MSKIITRRVVRLVQANLQVNQPQTSLQQNVMNQNQGTPARIQQSTLTNQSKCIANASLHAVKAAGYNQVAFKMESQKIQITGDNGKGELFVAELPIDNKGNIVDIKTDTLNVKNCDHAQEQFNECLKARGIEYKVTEVYDSRDDHRKTPVPLREKLERFRRMDEMNRGRMRN